VGGIGEIELVGTTAEGEDGAVPIELNSFGQRLWLEGSGLEQ
jgi:hypothetical protein